MAESLNSLLERLKVYVDLPLEELRTLDPGHYTSPELYDLEIEHIWKKEWICVGHICELKKPGDFFAFDLIDEPMMVIRGEDMQLRAISTVCRHRFMPIVRHGERGNANRFQCPYHRWTYGTDGRLKQALYMEENQAFDMDQVRMPEYRLEIWNDLIWVNLDDEAAPLAPKLVDLEEELSTYKVPDDWVAPYSYDEIWPANWKLCMENNENYHSMGVHHDTFELTCPSRNARKDLRRRGDFWSFATWSYSTDTEVAQEQLKRQSTDFQTQASPALDVYMIPPSNVLAPGPGSVGWFVHWPTGIDASRAWQSIATAPELVVPEHAADPTKSGVHKILNQDLIAFDGGIGWGVKSNKLEAGPLSWQESHLVDMHKWTARRILEVMG